MAKLRERTYIQWSGFIMSLSIIIIHSISSGQDRWIKNNKYTSDNHEQVADILKSDHWHLEGIKYFGLWKVCEPATSGTTTDNACIDSVLFIQSTLQSGGRIDPVWLHVSRFFLVVAVLCSGYALIISLDMLVNFRDSTVIVYVLNAFGYLLMTVVLAWTLPDGVWNHFPKSYAWSTSYILSWFGVVLGFLTTFVYVLTMHMRKDTVYAKSR